MILTRARITDVKTGKIEYEKVVGMIQCNAILGKRRLLSKSWDLQMIESLFVWLQGTGSYNMKNTAGAAVSGAMGSVMGGNGVVTNGIVIGTDTTAENVLDYKINTLITHGNTAGKVNYGGTSMLEPWSAGGHYIFEVDRTLTGNAVDIVTAREIALYSYPGANTFCLIRDVDIDVGGTPIGVGTAVTFKLQVSVALDYVRAFMCSWYFKWSITAPTIAVYDITHTDRKAVLGTQCLITGAVDQVDRGIVVGTDTTAATLDDYKLGTIIPAGSGLGQLHYSPQMIDLPYTFSNYAQMRIHRMVTNYHTAPVVIGEFGLYGYHANPFTACHMRSAVPAGITVNSLESKLLEYITEAVN